MNKPRALCIFLNKHNRFDIVLTELSQSNWDDKLRFECVVPIYDNLEANETVRQFCLRCFIMGMRSNCISLFLFWYIHLITFFTNKKLFDISTEFYEKGHSWKF